MTSAQAKIMPAIACLILVGLAPGASAQLAQVNLDPCQAANDFITISDGAAAAGCVIVSAGVGVDAADTNEDSSAPTVGLTTSATASMTYTRTNTGCTVKWETSVGGSSALARYTYEHGMTSPWTNQKGGINKQGPVADGLSGQLTVGRGTWVTIGSTIRNTASSIDSASAGASFKC